MSYLDTIGLALSFFGTLLIIFVYVKDPKEWVQDEEGMKPGEKWYSVLIKHPHYLILGIVLMAIGFLLSFIDTLLI